MPVTSLKVGNDNMMFITQQFDDLLTINLYRCDDDFTPTGQPRVFEAKTDEESYHRGLRRDSSEKGQFIPDFSTNPEWNPDYIEPQEEP